MTIVAAFIASVLHDRFKRPTPRYSFEFEKEGEYHANHGGAFFTGRVTENLKNYICLENYGAVSLFDVSTRIHFDKKKDRLHYQTIGVTEGVCDLEIDFLPDPLPLEYQLKHPRIPNLLAGREEVIEERTKTGFFHKRLRYGKTEKSQINQSKSQIINGTVRMIQMFGCLISQTRTKYVSSDFVHPCGET